MSEKKMDLILSKIEGLENKFGGFESKFEGLENEVDTIKQEQLRQGDHIHQLIKIVGTTNSQLSEVKNDIEILKENQQTVIAIQQDQQKILERLSVRSISQEADIAELRRIK